MGKPKVRILAVDDELFNLALLKNILDPVEYQVVGCQDALAALECFKKQKFDLVVLDVIMPGIDGFELRRLIRDIAPDIPVIFLTAMVDDAEGTLLRQVSDDDQTYYINKALDRDALVGKIRQALGNGSLAAAQKALVAKMEQDLDLGEEVQRMLLPPWCVADGVLLMSSLYLPRNKVSGDAFAALEVAPKHYLFFIGDIAGHGIQAALYMSAVQSLLKLIAVEWDESELSPNKILNRLNSFFFHELGGGNYMSCFVALIDFGTSHICCQNAGHPGVSCWSPKRGKTYLGARYDKGDIPVGWLCNHVYTAEKNIDADFEPDTVFFAYTDGLLDLQRPDGVPLLDMDGKQETGLLPLDRNVASLPFRIFAMLEKIGFTVRNDDLTLLAFTHQEPEPDGNRTEMLFSPGSRRGRRAAESFGAFVQQRTHDGKLAINVELLLQEFLNNVIDHGLGAMRLNSERIFIRLNVEPDVIDITVLDRGCDWDAFSRKENPEAILSELNGKMATSGRGMAIIRTIAKRIQHVRYAGLNSTRFLVDRAGKEPQ